MSKVLYADELAEIVKQSVTTTLIENEDDRTEFLYELGELVAKYFGGEIASVVEGDQLPPPSFPASQREPGDDSGYSISFHWSDNVPEDGGVFARFDVDVSIAEWQSDRTTIDHHALPRQAAKSKDI